MVEQGNEYVITVKANQKSLYQRVCAISADCTPVSGYSHTEHAHQRCTQWTVEVFDCLAGIAKDWLGTRKGKPYNQFSYYITSLATTARQFADGIRGHWGIENRLHWVKDVVFAEDDCPLKVGHALQNGGLFCSWAIDLFRLHGEHSITKAQWRIAHNIDALFPTHTMNSPWGYGCV